jgi:hypothetical protein
MRYSLRAFAVIAFVLAQALTLHSQTGSLSGEWKSGVLGNPSTGKTPQCVTVSLVARTLTLRPAEAGSNRFFGEWKKETTFYWLRNDGGACRWASESSFSLSSGAVITYSVEGTVGSSGQDLTLTGKFAGCDGSACKDWDLTEYRKPFQTHMLYRAGGLIDGDPGANSSVRFARKEEADASVATAVKAADAILGALDKGDYDLLFSSAWDSDSQTPEFRAQARAGFISARDARGYIVSRKPVREVYAEYAPEFAKSTGNYTLLVRDIQTSKSLLGREFVLMIQADTAWKVAWLNYGCLAPCPNGGPSASGTGR